VRDYKGTLATRSHGITFALAPCYQHGYAQ
jgi:hypothetical protein